MTGSTYDRSCQQLCVCRYTGVRVKPVTPLLPPSWHAGTVLMGYSAAFPVFFGSQAGKLYAKPKGLTRKAEFDAFFGFRSALDYDADRVVVVSEYLDI